MEGLWSLLRSWLRPHRGISQDKLPLYLGFFQFVHNARRRGKALLGTLVAGLVDLGWECDDVTAYRTVRAAPPPAPTRDAIKTGKFDAVVFTSSSTVRNLVGIAGKPHPSTIIAVIGPATAKTAEEHGLRVDVMAPKPDVDVLVDALADFGAARRAGMVEAGQPVTKPSEHKPSARRAKVRAE